MKISALLDRLDTIDHWIANFMNTWGIAALRVSLAIIFVWFGILKPLGISAANGLVLAKVGWMPFFEPETWVSLIGRWEVALGLFFLHRSTIRLALDLLALQTAGTSLPLDPLPEVTFPFGQVRYTPTIEGQYIIKNLLITSAALVVGGTVRK